MANARQWSFYKAANRISIKLFFLIVLAIKTINPTLGANGFLDLTAPPPHEPYTLGLTLSGGGARGLAHIGVLHVIDSLGIEIDYISGTSMGSIVGGMYAAGYSAAEIETFALQMDWEAMFSRNTDLVYIHPSHKDIHQRFFLEIPIEDWGIQLATGAIEGQQLWNTLNALFAHVFHIEDFSNLQIPFACVATNVESGEAVIMKDGDLVSAIRASMAIPSVFTTVERGGFKLIDGGVVNNFPVGVAKDMGADYVVGVNVSQGLRPAEELRTPLDVIYQMGFYSDARSFVENRQKTDLFIEPDLAGHTAASFARTEHLIEAGKVAARKAMDELVQLKRLEQRGRMDRVVSKEVEFVLDSINITGLINVGRWYALDVIGMVPGDTVSPDNITSAVNRLFATNYFTRVHYQLRPMDGQGHVLLNLEVLEKPITSLSAAIHFSSFTGVGLLTRISTNKLLDYNASASITLSIGEYPAFQGQIRYFLSDRRRKWLEFKGQGRWFVFPVYDNFEAYASYNQNNWRAEATFNGLVAKSGYYSLGLANTYRSLSPKIRGDISLDGSVRASELFFRYTHHSLDRNAFPRIGKKVVWHSGFVFGQSSSLNPIGTQEEEFTLGSLGIEIGNYLMTRFRWESYVPTGEQSSQFTIIQLGYHFKYNQRFINAFNLGGPNAFLYNQFTFSGLSEYGLISPSILTVGTGWRRHIGSGLHASATINAGLYDFEFQNFVNIGKDNLVYGGGLTLGYDSLVGPLELTFSYSPQTNRIIGFVNLGWIF